MQILFAITALSLLVLLWAGLAIRRHVLASAREREQRQERPPVTAAIEVELKQELRTAHVEAGFFGGITDPQPARHVSRPRPAIRDSAIRAAVTAVPIFEPSKTVETPQSGPQNTPQAAAQSSQPAVIEFRKPPVSIQGTTRLERLDLAHFNKDMGDLSDPYQVPRTAAARSRS